MSNKKVYIVSGSEDGNIAVASNIKAAYRIASDYLSDCNMVTTYSHLLSQLKKHHWAEVVTDGRMHVEITVMYMASK